MPVQPTTSNSRETSTIRVELPFHLRSLAGITTHAISLPVDGDVTTAAILAALEARYPMLLGTIRDQITQQRRPFLRFFACEQDLTHDPPDQHLPAAVASGQEVFIILGAIAGG